MSKLVVIGSVFPESNSSAAGGRMLQILSLFRETNWEIVFASSAQNSSYEDDLVELGIEKAHIVLNDDSFETQLKRWNPNVVLFDRFYIEEQFSWRVAKACPEAIRILDTEDLHCLREARRKAVQTGAEFKSDDLYSEVAKRELASILRSDLSLMVSEYEIEVLKQQFNVPVELLHYLPIWIEEVHLQASEANPSFNERSDFVFIGNFLHEPNWDAVRYLRNEVWDQIRERLPAAKLNIYGAYTSPKVQQLHQEKSGFLVHGRVENSLHCLQKARICLAPLRFGAGIKGKLIQSFSTGTPSITTSIGAESMHGEMAWPGVITDKPKEMALAAEKLYQNEAYWNECQQKAYQLAAERYRKSSYDHLFLTRLNALLLGVEAHRRIHFIGQVLMQHRQLSTRYLSKWISEKNQSKFSE